MKVLNTRKKPERIPGERVTLPMFEVVSNPTVRIADIKRRRFDIIVRAEQNARNEIAAREDKVFFIHVCGANIVSGRFDEEA